jgi:hypothetical protein
MAIPDSGRKPDDKERRASPSGTTYDLLLVLFTGGTVVFAFGAIASAIEGQYPFTVVYAVLAVLLAYLFYHVGRNRLRPFGQDFNL